jgi:autotransporter-associated beta strand protein
LAGSGSLTQAGSGTTTLSGSNSYSGGTFLNAGTLMVAADANLGSASGAITFNGGTLNSTASFTISATRAITLLGNAIFNVNASTTLIYNGGITGSGTLTKMGLGTLILGGSNSYTGLTTIGAGAVSITGSLADTADVTVASGASYNVNSADTINSILGDGSINLGANLSLASNTAFTFAGGFTGTGSVVKVGAGTLTLSGASTFTGETILNGSQLILANSDALGSSTVVSSGGFLQVADGFALSALRVNGPVTITGNVRTVGSQTYNGAVTIRPAAGNQVTIIDYAGDAISEAGVKISSSAGDITFNSTIDVPSGWSGKWATSRASLHIDAPNGTVTIGDSIGAANLKADLDTDGSALQYLYIGKVDALATLQGNSVSQTNVIRILADIKTEKEQTFVGKVEIGNNGRDGAFYGEFRDVTRPIGTFASASAVLTRTFISVDPLVRFIGSVNPVAGDIYSLAIASIFRGIIQGQDSERFMPRIEMYGLVGNERAFYSTNFQTLQATDVFALAGKISTMGVTTVASQTYSTNELSVTLNPSDSVARFRSSGSSGTINFDLSRVGGELNMGSAPGVTRVIIDGNNNFIGKGTNLASVGFPSQEAAAAAAAAASGASSGSLSAVARFEKQLAQREAGSSSSVSVSMDGANTAVNCTEENTQAVECK